MSVSLNIYRASFRGKDLGHQVSIDYIGEDGSGHGYRLTGPKFGASESRLVGSVKLSKRSADQIRRYLDKIDEGVSL